MAVASELGCCGFRPRRKLEDDPRECRGIGAIEGNGIESSGAQSIDQRCPVEENDRSPDLRSRKPAGVGASQLVLKRFWRQQVDDDAVLTEEGVDRFAAGNCSGQAETPGFARIIAATYCPPSEVKVPSLRGASVRPTSPALGNRIRTAERREDGGPANGSSHKLLDHSKDALLRVEGVLNSTKALGPPVGLRMIATIGEHPSNPQAIERVDLRRSLSSMNRGLQMSRHHIRASFNIDFTLRSSDSGPGFGVRTRTCSGRNVRSLRYWSAITTTGLPRPR